MTELATVFVELGWLARWRGAGSSSTADTPGFDCEATACGVKRRTSNLATLGGEGDVSLSKPRPVVRNLDTRNIAGAATEAKDDVVVKELDIGEHRLLVVGQDVRVEIERECAVGLGDVRNPWLGSRGVRVEFVFEHERWNARCWVEAIDVCPQVVDVLGRLC